MTWLQMVVGLAFAVGFAFVRADLRDEKLNGERQSRWFRFWEQAGYFLI